MARKIDQMSPEELKSTLESLISAAKNIESCQDSFIYEDRACAAYEAQKILDALLALDEAN